MSKLAKTKGRLQRIALLMLLSNIAAFAAPPAAQKLPPQIETPVVNLDGDWHLWLDKDASWQNDKLFLPDEIPTTQLPVNVPTGGWNVLNAQPGISVHLPATVEEYCWGQQGLRPFDGPWEDSSGAVQNGNYTGVSWWWRKLDIKAVPTGRRTVVSFRGARLRAEVYCNGRLCGYSIISEMPFSADITDAIKPGADNLLAVRITNPGGSMNWVDRETFKWGQYDIPYSHGFGGIDGGVLLQMRAAAEVTDLAVINKLDPHSVTLMAEISCTGTSYKGPVALAITQEGRPIWSGTSTVLVTSGKTASVATDITLNEAQLWDLDHPALYKATASLPGRADTGCSRDFGFRSFTATGIGTDAMLKLNGKRIVLRSANSCGWWAFSGLWPGMELAEKEVTAAKKLGLNCLQFHRNTGRPAVLEAQDRLGLLRSEEPGAGSTLFPKNRDSTAILSSGTQSVAGTAGKNTLNFAKRYELAKTLLMVKRDRSHPSLIAYCLQNEFDDADTTLTDEVFQRIQQLDPGRIIVLKSGARTGKQVLALPWTTTLKYDDGSGYSGWSDVHTTGGPGVYVDDLYKNPNDFSHRSNNRREIVVWGEMLGFAVPSDYSAIASEYSKSGLPGFDRADSEEIALAYEKFIGQYGFKTDFPSASALFKAIGSRSYFAWQKIIENCRISDPVDYFVLNAWEETMSDNHSGIVDLHRGFKADPALISRANLPEMLVIKARHLVLSCGEKAVVDLHLVNETNLKGTWTLDFHAKSEDGSVIFHQSDSVTLSGGDLFAQLLHEGYQFTVPTPGAVTLEAILTPKESSDATKPLDRTEELLAVQLDGLENKHSVAVDDLPDGRLLKALQAAPAFRAGPLSEAKNPDVILFALSEEHPFSVERLEAVRNGARLILISNDGKDLVEAAKKIAAAGIIKFNGSMGSGDLPWMGSWYFTRKHWLFNGLPSGGVMNWQYQVRTSGGEGLLIEAPGMEVAAGYGRAHQKNAAIGACAIPYGKGEIILFTFPGMIDGLCGDNRGIHPVAAKRMILNAIAH